MFKHVCTHALYVVVWVTTNCKFPHCVLCCVSDLLLSFSISNFFSLPLPSSLFLSPPSLSSSLYLPYLCYFTFLDAPFQTTSLFPPPLIPSFSPSPSPPLTSSPIGEVFRSRLRQFPSLITCCTINWFSEWPDEALQSVARNFLQDLTEIDSEIVQWYCEWVWLSERNIS